MATTENTSSSESDAEKPTVDEIQADIEQTRAELSETIEALGAKMDVKTRFRNKAGQVKEQAASGVGTAQAHAVDLTSRAKVAATDDDGKPLPAVVAGAAGTLVVLVVLLVWRQRR